MELLPGEWMKVFDGVDVSVMISIGVIAFFLEYSKRISDGWAVLLPLILGGIYGAVSASAYQATDGASLVTHIFVGIMKNGAAGSVFGRGVSFALDKYFAATVRPSHDGGEQG